MNEPQTYRRKPVEVEVIRWTGENIHAVEDFMTKGLAPMLFRDAPSGDLWALMDGVPLPVGIGDYFVLEGGGIGLYSRVNFKAEFEPIDQGVPA